MTIRIEGLPAGFEGANAIRKMFGLVAKLNHAKVKLNASIGVPGVPSRATPQYPSAALPNYTQTAGSESIQQQAVGYLQAEGCIAPDARATNVMVTPGRIGAFSHLIRSTITIGSKTKVYVDPTLPDAESYRRAVLMHGGVVVDVFDAQNPPVIAAVNDFNPNLALEALRAANSTLIFADGVAKTGERPQISSQADLQDRMIVHRYVPSAEVGGEQLFPDIGIVHTSVSLQRDGFEQPLIQRLCAAQEHAQTCLPDVSVADAQKVLAAAEIKLIAQQKTVTGSKQSRDLVAQEFNRFLPEGIGATPENVMLSVGGTGVLFNFVHALLPTGGRIGIFNPYFVAYNGPLVEKQVAVEKLELLEGRPSIEAFAAQVKALDAVLINNPSNPLGIVFTREELSGMIDALTACEAKVFLDDTYNDLVFDDEGRQCESNPFMKILEEKINAGGAEALKYQALKQRCVVQISASKAIGGDPAKRCGMVYTANAEYYDAMARVQECSIGYVPQHVDGYATAVLGQRNIDLAAGTDAWTQTAASTYGARSVKAKEFSQDVEGIGRVFEMVSSPNGGFFAMVRFTP